MMVRKKRKSSGNSPLAMSGSISCDDGLNRRRSLSLDNLGQTKVREEARAVMLEVMEDKSTDEVDVDEAIDIESEETDESSFSNDNTKTPAAATATPIVNSGEEWSPSPASTIDNRMAVLPAASSLGDLNSSGGGKLRSHPKGFVNNCLTKVKNIMASSTSGGNGQQ